MNVACPECRSLFRVDPARVPAAGVRARCAVCGGVIMIAADAAGSSATPVPAPVPAPAPAPSSRATLPTPEMLTAAVAARAPSAMRPPEQEFEDVDTRFAPQPAGAAPQRSAPALPSQPTATAPVQPPVARAPVTPPMMPRRATPAAVQPPVAPRPASGASASAPAAPLGGGAPTAGPRPVIAPGMRAGVPPAGPAGSGRPAPVFTPPIARPAIAAPAGLGGPRPPLGPPAHANAPRPPLSAAPVAAPVPAAMPVALAEPVPAAMPGAVSIPASAPTAHAAAPAPAPAPAAPAEAPRRPMNPFLANDPNQKARRLARALVSDMVVYQPQKRDEGLRNGTLKQLFREEIKKSYEEYVDQIGKELADGTSHFQDALNDVLAGGKKLF